MPRDGRTLERTNTRSVTGSVHRRVDLKYHWDVLSMIILGNKMSSPLISCLRDGDQRYRPRPRRPFLYSTSQSPTLEDRTTVVVLGSLNVREPPRNILPLLLWKEGCTGFRPLVNLLSTFCCVDSPSTTINSDVVWSLKSRQRTSSLPFRELSVLRV